MAHDFLGTFNKSQFDRFVQFARSQTAQVEARVAHLQAEINRVGVLVFRYEGPNPASFAADPVDSYVGKLLAAYEVLGGNAFNDLRTRTTSQAVFVLRASEAGAPNAMSNGEIIGAKGLGDAQSAELVRQARTWIDDVIDYRLDRLERKIRRMIDYTDEMQKEIAAYQLAASAAPGSLEKVAEIIQQLFTDPGYRAIFDDAGKDPFALTTYAPFSSYDVAKSRDPNIVDRENEAPQRQGSGFVGAGEKGTA